MDSTTARKNEAKGTNKKVKGGDVEKTGKISRN